MSVYMSDGHMIQDQLECLHMLKHEYVWEDIYVVRGLIM